MIDKLDKNILSTIAYYDGLNYPLTAFEIWKYLIRSDYHLARGSNVKITLSQILKRLDEQGLSSFLERYNGFYFLRGRKDLVERRLDNCKISAEKIKNLRKIVWWLRMFPFVKMIGATGGVAMKNANNKSDLDLFVVLKYGKIWTGRTIITAMLHIFGKRRHGKKVKDRTCLNFFVTDQTLEVITKDLFSASEYMFLFPLYGFETFNRFQLKNRWIQKMKPSFGLTEIEPQLLVADSSWVRIFRELFEIILAPKWIEAYLGKIERKKIMQNPKTHQDGSLVYASDDALVFLPDPHGPKVFEKFKEKMEKLAV